MGGSICQAWATELSERQNPTTIKTDNEKPEIDRFDESRRQFFSIMEIRLFLKEFS